ncbi:uncharacterized protein DUF938 [Breoghania corrubedonensis]|uniref:Uncharacterized protein DUF938 n=1 Tax=Breoghania corrubedonensis TaxID=665038 RepID=A0A2T5V9F0_9HYPH|nr:DUF938 domain-containing protein [Breoghania corrubedonensis]PTW60386.1 uncharacterized protein DUF938 [Breoghania corrubedonensis]
MPQNTDRVPGTGNLPPFSQAAENNKGPIGDVLRDVFANACSVLEIASGTGQHANHMARMMPHLTWQPSDLSENMPGLAARHALDAPPNLLPPIELDISRHPWPVARVDAIFAANCLHIVSWPLVKAFFAGAGQTLATGGTLAVYGPFKYGGAFTTESNRDFDTFLRARDPQAGIRDIEAVDELARERGLTLERDCALPANNQLVVWRRS